MAKYSIKDLENFTGIKAHTIRIWEKRYKFVLPERTETNIRYYSDTDLRRLLNVSILNRHGIKISKIIKLSEEAISDMVLELSQKKGDIEIQLETLVVAMIELDESKFEKIFNTAVINYGFEETILKLMYPFFERIGILWQIGSINPAQEHFISNLLRQKLIVAVDGITSSMNGNSKTFLLFLPEGEHHELGLLFYQYLIKKHRHIVYYLGETVPYSGLIEISNTKKFDFLVTSLNTSGSVEEIQSYVHALAENFEKSTIYITGLFTTKMNFMLPPNIILLEDVFKLKSELDKISKL